MTLETAKRLVEEGHTDKEAEAVVRGGMNICEKKEDRSRKYYWIKVMPTMTDAESSINLAMDNYRKRRQPKKSRVVLPLIEERSTPKITEPEKESEQQTSPILPRLVSTLKGKFSNFVKIMDEIVDE